jgi:hypothetical protein
MGSQSVAGARATLAALIEIQHEAEHHDDPGPS